LHEHDGFSIVKDGTITLPGYRALLARLYGFYQPFEHAVGGDCSRTQWLERDLAWLGDDAASISRIPLCLTLPLYDSPGRRLGALYVAEGSALGGRQLGRGLDRLLGAHAIEGRCFFAGRGAGTAKAWLDFLGQLASVGRDPASRAPVIGAAVETFQVFEAWLGGWSEVR
jgi:heme oxygenase